MNGEEAYVLSKALTAAAAAGIKNYNISSTGLLTMETSDGQHLSYQFNEPVSVTVNENNHLIVTYTNGSEDAGEIKTLKGDKGEKGDPGNDGFTPSASVAKDGDTATITIRDKTGQTTATVKDGIDGTDGTDGSDGEDGYCPQVTVNTETSDTYKLDLTYRDATTGEVETITTPNLKGSGGGSDDPLTPEQLESLINILI